MVSRGETVGCLMSVSRSDDESGVTKRAWGRPASREAKSRGDVPGEIRRFNGRKEARGRTGHRRVDQRGLACEGKREKSREEKA